MTITKVNEFVSFGKPVDIFKEGDLLIEETHAYPFEPIKIFLQNDSTLQKSDESLLREIRLVLNDKKRFPAYKLVNNARQAQYFLHFLRSQAHQAPELHILTPDRQLLHDNLQISFSEPTKAIKKLQTNLNKLARIREFKALKSHHPDGFPGRLQTQFFKPALSCQGCDKCFPFNKITYCFPKNNQLKNLQGKEFSIQELLVFSITNESKSNKALYFYLLSISPDGAIEMLFPSPYEAQRQLTLIKAKKKATNISPLLLDQKKEWTLKLIATSKSNPIDVSVLTAPGFERSRSYSDPLERLLNHAMTGQRQSVKIPQSRRWATEQVSFQVK